MAAAFGGSDTPLKSTLFRTLEEGNGASSPADLLGAALEAAPGSSGRRERREVRGPAWMFRSVQERLFEEPYSFNFFQAVRLLSRLYPDCRPVGGSSPKEEVVRFRARLALTFPPSQIYDLNRPPRTLDYRSDPLPAATDGPTPPPLAMTVAFMGLTGPAGVLPRHYTEELLKLERKSDREVRERHALRAWFDLFNHRLISLFYRAWEKYRFYLAFERGRYRALEPDGFVKSLLSLVGVGFAPLRNRLKVAVKPAAGQAHKSPEVLGKIDDLSLLYYSGFFAQRHRCAVSLRAMLEEYFQLPVGVQQFKGQWLCLDQTSQSRLGGDPAGNNQLGVSLVAGDRVWDVQSKFRVRIGPVGYDKFQELLPDPSPQQPRKAFFLLCQLVRLYVGPDLDFDVQVVLKKEDVSGTTLAEANGHTPRLGWNTWLCSKPASKDAEDAVFEGRELTSVG